MRTRPANSASNVVHFGDYFDFDELSFFAAFLRLVDTLVDVGANIGTYGLAGANFVGPGGMVVAFEPQPVAADRLRENVRIDHLEAVIEVHECAASDVDGLAQLLDDVDVSTAS